MALAIGCSLLAIASGLIVLASSLYMKRQIESEAWEYKKMLTSAKS
jgi:hypothetical protein